MSINSLEDHILLASNVKSYSETNTISHFRTKLPRRRIFPAEEDWRVALTEITYKQSVFNIREDVNINFITESGDETVVPIKPGGNSNVILEGGFYRTVDEIISFINFGIEKASLDVQELPKFYFSKYNRKVHIKPGELETKVLNRNVKFIPSLGEEIEKMLGLVDSRGMTISKQILIQKQTRIDADDTVIMMKIKGQFEKDKIVADYPADINGGFNNIYIYSNLVQQTDVGDAFAPILATLPNRLSNEGWGGSIHHEPKNLIYRPLQTRNFDTIEIDIRDDSGRRIPFKLGNIVLKLHFLKHE